MKLVNIGPEIQIQKRRLLGNGPSTVELVKCTEKLMRT